MPPCSIYTSQTRQSFKLFPVCTSQGWCLRTIPRSPHAMNKARKDQFLGYPIQFTGPPLGNCLASHKL